MGRCFFLRFWITFWNCSDILVFLSVLNFHLIFHLDDRIISERGEGWTHRNSLTPPCSIKVHVPNQESEWSCLFVDFTSFYDFRLYFGTVQTVWYFSLVVSSPIFEYNNTFVFYFSVFNFPLIFEYNNTYDLLSSCTIVVYGEELLYFDTKVTCLDL